MRPAYPGIPLHKVQDPGRDQSNPIRASSNSELSKEISKTSELNSRKMMNLSLDLGASFLFNL